VPASVHPAPIDVAVVGLGSGDTAWAASYRTETRSTTVFEISAPQPRILWRLVGLTDVPDTRRLLEDPRVVILVEDGRKALEADPRTYDLIEADATWPETSGSGNLYSLEFFRAAGRRLKPGGILCTWAPTERVYATFRAAFPHVLELDDGQILIGSRAPVALEPDAWARRAREGAAYLGVARARDVERALRSIVAAGRAPRVEPNRDLFPRDEYGAR
jgi:spermidine synthase